MQDNSAKDLKTISKQLNLIIAILLEINGEDEKKSTNRSRILRLNELGLRPVEIAEILNKKSSYINKELANIRK